MICNRCNNNLPDDSEFCQYCGKKLEKGFFVSTEILDEQISSDENLESPLVNDISEKNNSIDSKFAESSKAVIKTQGNIENKDVPKKANTIIQNIPKKNANKSVESKLIFFSNISATTLSAISFIVSSISLMALFTITNSSDLLSEFLIELIIFLAFGVSFGISLSSFLKKKFKLLASISPVLVVVNIWLTTVNFNWWFSEFADVVCVIGVVSAILIFIFSLFPVFFVTNNKRKTKRYKSIRYRESCYKKIDKMHGYLERGIITKEEYEKTREDILKNVIP